MATEFNRLIASFWIHHRALRKFGVREIIALDP